MSGDASYVLGIETSTPTGGAALAEIGGNVIASRRRRVKNGFARRLLATIDELIQESGSTRESIDAIAVTHGPGAFTGVRVGVVTAKTLAHALGIPLYLYSTLETLAMNAPLDEGLVCAMLDARRSEIYSGIYVRAGFDRLNCVREEKAEPSRRTLEALAEILSAGGGEVWMTGDAAESRRAEIQEILGDRARIVPPPWNLPSPDAVALRGVRDFTTGAKPVDPFEAAPVYLRASDAERKNAATAH